MNRYDHALGIEPEPSKDPVVQEAPLRKILSKKRALKFDGYLSEKELQELRDWTFDPTVSFSYVPVANGPGIGSVIYDSVNNPIGIVVAVDADNSLQVSVGGNGTINMGPYAPQKATTVTSTLKEDEE